MRVFRPLRPGGEGLGAHNGSNSGLPNVMLRPVMARMIKQVAVIQWTKRSKALKRTMFAARASALDLHHAAPQIENNKQRQHAENGDAADPAKRDFVETAASRGPPGARYV